MRIPIRRGRDFTPFDGPNSVPVAIINDTMAREIFLLSGFALLASTDAIVGVYGVMSYTVTQRAREIGLRVALGADRRQVVWMVVGRGVALAAAGIAAGLLGALAATRLLTGLLFGVTATDPATLTACAIVLATTSLAAEYVPATRASRTAPAMALKTE